MLAQRTNITNLRAEIHNNLPWIATQKILRPYCGKRIDKIHDEIG